MSARWMLVLSAAVFLAGCGTQSQFRPCGPGILNNALIPQGFAGADFRCACQAHDDCYEAGCPRKACDEQFLNDMLAACECSSCPGLCRLRAWQWYWQVRLFAGPLYRSSQRNGGGCGGCGCAACEASPYQTAPLPMSAVSP